MANSECECPESGWCKRHKMYKEGRLYELCSTRSPNLNRYWQAWERGQMGATRPVGSKIPLDGDIKPRSKQKGVPRKRSTTRQPQLSDAETIEVYDLQCVHRSVESTSVGACDRCGSKGQPLLLYECDFYESEVAIRPKNSKLRACMHCPNINAEKPADYVIRPRVNGELAATVFVTTAERGGENYLPECLRSISEAGYGDVNVFAEPGVKQPDGVDDVVGYWTNAERRLWAWPNFQRGFNHAIAQDADYVLYVQDDVLLAKNLKPLIDAMVPRMSDASAVWSLYFAETTRTTNRIPDAWEFWHIRDHRAVRGACAMVFPMNWARKMALDYSRPKQRAGIEIRLWEFCQKRRVKFCYFGPQSLAQHIGAASSIHKGLGLTEHRVAQSDWVRDASELDIAELAASEQHSDDSGKSTTLVLPNDNLEQQQRQIERAGRRGVNDALREYLHAREIHRDGDGET